jgi:spore coat polysaccharide biosynthesis protein SpsF
MSSTRLPGKALSLINGRPVLWWVIYNFLCIDIKKEQIILLTSTEVSDDPLVTYAEQIGVPVFRGSLENVYARFVEAEKIFPCEWIIRVTGDSPFIPLPLARYFIEQIDIADASFITSTFRRTLPIGMNLEAFKSKLLRELLSAEGFREIEREHFTSNWHRGLPEDGLISVELHNADFSTSTVAIDTAEDLYRANESDFKSIINAIPWKDIVSRKVTNSTTV